MLHAERKKYYVHVATLKGQERLGDKRLISDKKHNAYKRSFVVQGEGVKIVNQGSVDIGREWLPRHFL